MTIDSLNLEDLRLPPGHEKWAKVPIKIQKRRRHFTKFPMAWYERLKGASGHTCRLAIYLQYLHWKGKGGPITLANGMLRIDGISRYAKWKALDDLERRGLITVERRPRRSPIIRMVV
jgi:hypothetical protein